MNRTTRVNFRALTKAAQIADTARFTITAKGLHALAALGSPVPDVPAVPVVTWFRRCSIEGCTNPAEGRNTLCDEHGDPDGTIRRAQSRENFARWTESDAQADLEAFANEEGETTL